MVDTPDQMRDEPELDLVKSADEPVVFDAPPRPYGWWIAGVILVIVAGFAGYYLVGFRSPAPQEQPARVSQTPAVEPVPVAPQPLGADAAPVNVPPLDETDAVVRTMVKALSGNPRVAAWLTTNGLIRNFTVVVANIADGASPARHLGVLRPTTPFRVVERGRDMRVDPRSFERYNSLAAAADAIDPAGAARLYSTLKPRIAEAYRDLGQPDTPFDRTLERAIDRLLEVPVVEGPWQVRVSGGTGYAFVDPNLEELTPAQKQLLRMGPDNVRVIQGALRRVAQALGIPDSRLPVERVVRTR